MKSGVPRSHLGPLFFDLFINDVKACFLFSKFLIFADDVKMFNVITSNDDLDSLQQDFSNFAEWRKLIGLVLNVEKCQVLSFSRGLDTVFNDYEYNGTELNRVNEHKDFGVTV